MRLSGSAVATRFAVDVGGTFTDLIFSDDATGEVRVAKTPTTPAAPEDGVLTAIAAALSGEELAAAVYFLHATTAGLNALITRRGARVGLLATRGFRDVLEVGRGDRAEPFDLFWRAPAPLVPRRLRLPVTERMLANGTVRTPLEEDDVREALARFAAEDVAAIAIAFMNAYAAPEHELSAEAALRRFGFRGEIALSHRISGEYREYERTSTTVIDAYVRPLMRRYLRTLERRLRERGFSGTAVVTRSGGGAMTFAEAEERPFETIMSGPVAGAQGAAELARLHGLSAVITADVGGTSFDTSLITEGSPALMYEGAVEGMPVQSPWVDVRSVGAGGGSLASVDAGGLLRVGPQSAGAVPGPACYGRGGEHATVTDAALVLGMLGEGRVAQGLVLDGDRAERALAPLGAALGLSVAEVARGIVTISAASMASAIREITVERGRDPRDAVLMAFGGAGPLFATLLARELELREVVVPPHAGIFSAWGLLGADLTHTMAQTHIMALDDVAIPVLDELADRLIAELRRRVADDDGYRPELALDLRYARQEHTLTVAVPCGDDGALMVGLDEIRAAFADEYARAFGHTIDETLECVSLRATIRRPLPRPAPGGEAGSRDVGPGDGPPAPTVAAWSFTRAELMRFRLIERTAVDAAGVAGPAIVTEPSTTTYLDAEFVARRGDGGLLHITDTREPR